MSAEADNVEFRTILDAVCIWHDCKRPAETVAIVTGDYGTDCLAGYCSECADDLDGTASHTFIGEVNGRV